MLRPIGTKLSTRRMHIWHRALRLRRGGPTGDQSPVYTAAPDESG